MGRRSAAPGQRVAKATTLQREDRENRGDARNRPAGPSGAAASQAAEEDEDLGPCPNRFASHPSVIPGSASMHSGHLHPGWPPRRELLQIAVV